MRSVRLSVPSSIAVFVALGVAHAAGAPPVDLRIPRIDKLLDEATRATHPYDLRARFGRQALDELAPLLRAAPDDPELHYLTALGWVAVADQKGPYRPDAEAARHAHEEFDAVLRLAPDGARAEDVHVERGILLSKQQRFAESAVEYEKALALHALGGPYPPLSPLEHGGSRAALLYGNAAETLMALGRLDEAIAYYRFAIEHTTRDAARLVSMPHWGLAVALDRDGQEEKSRAELKLALIHDPELVELDDRDVFFVPEGEKLYYKALGWLWRGRLADAASSLRAYLDTHPQPRWAARARVHLDEIERAQRSSSQPARSR